MADWQETRESDNGKVRLTLPFQQSCRIEPHQWGLFNELQEMVFIHTAKWILECVITGSRKLTTTDDSYTIHSLLNRNMKWSSDVADSILLFCWRQYSLYMIDNWHIYKLLALSLSLIFLLQLCKYTPWIIYETVLWIYSHVHHIAEISEWHMKLHCVSKKRHWCYTL